MEWTCLLLYNAAEPPGKARQNQLGGFRGFQVGCIILVACSSGGATQGVAGRPALTWGLSIGVKTCAAVPSERREGHRQHEPFFGEGSKETCSIYVASIYLKVLGLDNNSFSNYYFAFSEQVNIYTQAWSPSPCSHTIPRDGASEVLLNTNIHY